jgi:hypothetical protein
VPEAQAAVHVAGDQGVEGGVPHLGVAQPPRLPVAHRHPLVLGEGQAKHATREGAQAQPVVPKRGSDLRKGCEGGGGGPSAFCKHNKPPVCSSEFEHCVACPIGAALCLAVVRTQSKGSSTTKQGSRVPPPQRW